MEDNTNKKKETWTIPQQRVIASCADELLVSASAGSGKTSVMIERIARLIEKGENLEDMAVVTFTRAAASDMRLKLTKRLYELKSELVDVEKIERLNRALLFLPEAEISTIHGWCQRMIKNYFYALNIDPAFEVMEDTEAAALLNGAIASAIEAREKTNDSDFALLYEIFQSGRKCDQLIKLIENILRFVFSQSDGEDWFKNCMSYFNRHEELVAKLKKIGEEKFKKPIKKVKEVILRCEMAEYPRALDVANNLLARLNSFGEVAAVRLKTAGRIEEKENLTEEVLLLRKEADALFKEYAILQDCVSPLLQQNLANEIISLAKEAANNYVLAKNGNLDYSDLEHYAKQILQSEFSEEITSKYKYIFIDEYQDVNPLQESIFGFFNSVMFFVGDVKQSIYAFRMCSPEMFVNRYNNYKKETPEENSSGGNCNVENSSGENNTIEKKGKRKKEAIELNKNFRSEKEILDFCNLVFSHVMTPECGGIDYKTSSMLVAGLEKTGAKENKDEESEAAEKVVSARLIKAEESEPEEIESYDLFLHKENKNIWLEKEADEIVKKVIKLLGGKITSGEVSRPVMFSDIVVLLRSDGDGSFSSLLTKKMREVGIAASPLKDSVSIQETSVTLELINYFRLILNRKDDVTLAAVLLSSLGGFSEEELAVVKRTSETKENFFSLAERFAQSYLEDANSIEKNEKEAAANNTNSPDSVAANSIDSPDKVAAATKKETLMLKKRFSEFYNKLNRYQTLSESLKADELAGIITAENGYFLKAFACGNSDFLAEFLSNMSKLKCNDSALDFVEYLNQLDATLEKKAEVNAVRIMTIHAAKGLEFPFVILAGIEKNFDTRDYTGNALLDSEYGLGLKYFDDETKEKKETSVYRIIKEKKKAAKLTEELRILYVGLTRAKLGLSIFGIAPKDYEEKDISEASSFLDILYPFLFPYLEGGDDEDYCLNVTKRNILGNTNEALVNKIKERLDFTYPFKGKEVKTTATILSNKEAEEADEQAYFKKTEFVDGDRAIEKGNAYHFVMEKLDFSKEFFSQFDRIKEVYPLLVSLVDEGEISIAFAKMKSETEACSVFKELPFIIDDDGTLLQGVIDALVVSNNSYKIIDYKTSKKENAGKKEYDVQTMIYAKAVAKLLNAKKVERKIYSFALGDFLTFSPLEIK